MSLHLSKKSILKKTALVGALTLLSRLIGIIREFLIARYLGIGAISDVFFATFKFPNFFRHIFAEGALNASFLPVFVKTVKEGNRKEANGLMTISFLFFEGIVLAIYLFVLFKTRWIFMLLAPGFSAEQIAYGIPFLRILFSFLFFISSSALLAGALNSVNHFFIPALGTPLWNTIFVLTLLTCISFNLPPTYLCAGIIFGAMIQFCMLLITFFRFNFRFGPIDAGVKAQFGLILTKFVPCLLGVGIVELNLFIGGSIASFLPKGDMSLLYLASRFMNIPLGMFAVAFSNVMLAHFSRMVLYAPRRLNFYVLEVAKFITWAIAPIMIFLMLISYSLFSFFLSTNGTPLLIEKSGLILIFYSSGLVFLCFNKIILSMFYALKNTKSATIAAGTCALINISGDVLSLKYGGVYGMALANTISAFCMTTLCLTFLYKRHGILFYGHPYLQFLKRFALQFFVIGTGVSLTGFLLYKCMILIGLSFIAHAFWFLSFAIILFSIFMILLFTTKRRFNVQLYFLGRR